MATKQVCTQCGTVGTPKRTIKGNVVTEIVFWCFFLLPGLLYSIWRLSTKADVCPTCRHPTMIPVTSPEGQRLLQVQPPRS